MSEIKGKRILLISVSYFGYQNEIMNKIIEKGAIVDMYDERPCNSVLVKSLIRINKNILFFYINSYYNRIITETTNKKYDYILVINGEAIFPRHIQRLKEIHSESKTVLYLWDSLRNKPRTKNLLGSFDKVFSFDQKDCKQFSLEFLPLFYIDEYKYLARNENVNDIDVLFVGTIHSDRYQILKEIKRVFEQKGCNVFYYMFFSNKVLYYFFKYVYRTLDGVNVKSFYFKPISKSELSNLFSRSRIIVDVQHPNQIGLTMRNIEVVGAKRKLITTNNFVKNYDIYNEENFCVIDRKNIEIPDKFIHSSYKDYDEDIYCKYGLEFWIETLLSCDP